MFTVTNIMYNFTVTINVFFFSFTILYFAGLNLGEKRESTTLFHIYLHFVKTLNKSANIVYF